MKLVYATAFAMASTAAFADGHATGDAAAGEEAFAQCVTCHVITDADGNQIAGRNARTGPNLYGVAGRVAGSVDGFRYGKSMVEAGEAGLMWDEENFVAYVQDPNGYLREKLDNRRARGNMAFQIRGADAAEEAANLWAYLVSVGPAVEEEMMEKEEEAASDS